MSTFRRPFALAPFAASAAALLAVAHLQAGSPTPMTATPHSLSDAQIAHVAVTANAIDVEMARLALSRSPNPDVLRFARTMIADHTAVNERAAALAERLGVTPEPNDVSRSLREDAEAARAKLEGLSGTTFDRAYIEREIAYHQAVLDALDDLLIPGADNGELRSLLRDVRPAIAAHLDNARAIGESLAANR